MTVYVFIGDGISFPLYHHLFGCQWTVSEAIKQKSRVNAWLYTGSWTFLDAVKQVRGGEEGIRTLDRLLTYTRFPGVRLQPLIHLSVEFEMIAPWQAQVKIWRAIIPAFP